MTKFTILTATAFALLGFGPALAYGFEPAPQSQVLAPAPIAEVTIAQDVCAMAITPLLAELLALPEDWQPTVTRAQTALVCADS